MAITFDGATKIITLDSASVLAEQVWSRWVDWHASNSEWPLAFMLVGGISLGGGLFIPPYFFLTNGWRVRPMEADHTCVITGNLFVDGGGIPVVRTIGDYNVSVQYTVPVQAQAFDSGGGGGAAPTAEAIAAAVRIELSVELARIDAVLSSRSTPDDIPSPSAIRAALAGLDVNVTEMNGHTVTGDGSSGNKIRVVP